MSRMNRKLLRIRTEYQPQLQAATQESTAEIWGLYERIERLRREHEQIIENIRGDHEKRIAAVDALRAEFECLRKGEQE